MPIRPFGKRWMRVLSIVFVLFGTISIVFWLIFIPHLIVGQLEVLTGGKVEFDSWWFDHRSSGVTGLRIIEDRASKPDTIVTADEVSTDLSLATIWTKGFAPGRVQIRRPEIKLRLDRDGKPLTKLGGSKQGSGQTAQTLPIITVETAKVRIVQEGRPEMVVEGVTGRLGPDSEGTSLAARTNDPNWGPAQAIGHLSNDLTKGEVTIKSIGKIDATPDRARSIPFVPVQVWENVLPTGEVEVETAIAFQNKTEFTLHSDTTIRFRSTDLDSPSLGLKGRHANGAVTIKDGLIRLESIGGDAIGGRVVTDGFLDFDQKPPRADLNISLDNVEVAQAPDRWQISELGVNGRLTGKAHVVGIFKPEGIDLSGTTGEGTVRKGSIQGIPFESLKLNVKANGDDLQYETPKPAGSSQNDIKKRFAAIMLTAFQPPAVPKDQPERPKPTPLPVTPLRSISTHIEFADVDLTKIISRAEVLLGYTFPIPVAGRFGMKADATIPLGRLKGVKGYAFHGDLVLEKASIDGVDIGKVNAKVDLADGVLNLKSLRGILVDHPNGGLDNPPARPAIDVPLEGAIPPGGFRGDLRAELDPLGRFTSKFEGNDLPLGELAAPALPKPTPLAGLTTVNLVANADLAKLKTPDAWQVSGTAQSRNIRFYDASLNEVVTQFSLSHGLFVMNRFQAILDGKPLEGQGQVALAAPGGFSTSVRVKDWRLDSLRKWVPNVPAGLAIGGILSGEAQAKGTLTPLTVSTDGQGELEHVQVGSANLGQLPFSWTTVDETIHLRVARDEPRPLGGSINGEAAIPLKGEQPIHGTLALRKVDAKELAALLPTTDLDLSGTVNGLGRFAVHRDRQSFNGELDLTSTELKVRGLPAEKVKISLRGANEGVRYQFAAEGLGGRFDLSGELPLSGNGNRARNQPNGEFQAINFRIEPLWKAMGRSGRIAEIKGRGAVDANLRLALNNGRPELTARGIAEFRDLTWGARRPLAIGRLKGVVAYSPTTWRLDPLGGEILGGELTGNAWGNTLMGEVPETNFAVRLDHASIEQIRRIAATALPKVDGHATIRLAGTARDAIHANGEVLIPEMVTAGIRLKEVKLPVSIASDASANAIVVHLRQWSARVAGAGIRGDSTFRSGESQAFQNDIQVTDLDLESLARSFTDANRPASGKISGRLSLSGHHPGQPKSYRGSFSFDLNDASLVALPVFREVDRFLGSARGGLFEDGDLEGTISNGHWNVESMTLEGRIAQLHATGTVGFDGELNLEVLINTSQLIPQTGKALAGLIPGLSGASGRTRESTAKVASFLSNRLLKLRVTGTLRNPVVGTDPSVGVADTAVSFFGDILKIPLGVLD